MRVKNIEYKFLANILAVVYCGDVPLIKKARFLESFKCSLFANPGQIVYKNSIYMSYGNY